MPEIWFPNIGIEITHLDRVAFSILGREVYWYGIFIGIGVMLGISLAMKEAKRTGQNPDTYIDFMMYALVIGILGARLYYVAFSWDYYSMYPEKIFAISEGGLAIYGGVIAGVITAWVYSKVKKIDFWLFTDTMAPSLIFAQMLGRWGNFFNREAFGEYTEGIFAMRYQVSQVRPSDISQNTLDNIQIIEGIEYIQVHPTFLYESVWNLGVFLLLFYMTRRKKFNGQITGLYFLCYGLGRVWIEGLRTDQLMIGEIAVSQALSGVLVLGAVVFLVWRNKQTKKLPVGSEPLDTTVIEKNDTEEK